MDIKISIVLKDKTYGFSDLLDGRELNQQTKKEIIDLIKEDIGYVFDQQIEVEAINFTHCCTELKDKAGYNNIDDLDPSWIEYINGNKKTL